MKPLLRYMRQLHQRRMHAFFFSDADDKPVQLSLQHVPHAQDRARSLRALFAELEYDSDDDGNG